MIGVLFSRIFLIFIALSITNFGLLLEAGNEGENQPRVTITKSQYCLSCKETVSLYSNLAAREIANMQKAGKPAMSSLEANQLANYICDDVAFNPFQPWMRYGCMKLLEDNYLSFLEQFSGQVSASDLSNKAMTYKRKRRVCSKIAKACHPSEFKRSNVTSAQRTTCNACRLLAEDMENYFPAFRHREEFETFLRDTYCDAVGSNFYPYLWIEEICEEMIEEHLRDILSILKLQSGILRSGLRPTDSTPDIMCEEFYGCRRSNSETDTEKDEL